MWQRTYKVSHCKACGKNLIGEAYTDSDGDSLYCNKACCMEDKVKGSEDNRAV